MTPLIVVGPLPPPWHGLSVTFEFLRDHLVANGIKHYVIDTADRRHWPGVPRAVRRLIEWIGLVARYLTVVVRRPTTVYLIIAQSRGGFLRDAVIVSVASLFRHRIVLHANCGNYGGFWRAQPPILRHLIRLILRAADTVIVPSARLVSMFDFEPQIRERILVVPNAAPPVSEESFRGRQLGDRELRLVFLSNFIPGKGYGEVIRTVKILQKEYGIPVRCELVGEFLLDGRKMRADLERTIAAEELEQYVAVRPAANRERKQAILRANDFLLLPTQYEIEAQPLAVIEALAAGCVPIAPAFRAIPDLIVDGETGALAGPDAEEMARVIAQLYADPSRYTAMSRAAAAHHRANFTAEQYLRRIQAVLWPTQHARGA